MRRDIDMLQSWELPGVDLTRKSDVVLLDSRWAGRIPCSLSFGRGIAKLNRVALGKRPLFLEAALGSIKTEVCARQLNGCGRGAGLGDDVKGRRWGRWSLVGGRETEAQRCRPGG